MADADSTPVAPQALCAPHALVALATCERCGAFCCARCLAYGVERRCPACRGTQTRTERAERRLNAARRATAVHCQRCGYAGPKLETLPAWSLLRVGALVVTAAVGLSWMVALAMASTRVACPRCGDDAQLFPLGELSEQSPSDHEAFQRACQHPDFATPARQRTRGWLLGASMLLTLGWLCASLVSLMR